MKEGLAAEHAGRFVHWGVVLISYTNLAIIAAMVLLFVLAIVLPFPGNRRRTGSGSGS